MCDTDVAALAASLNATAEHLAEHIEARAEEIAEPQIAGIQRTAKSQLDRLQHDHASETRRKDDLVAELRRQLDRARRSVERLDREVKETRAAIRRLEAIRIWRNEDDRWFYFAEDVHGALAESGSPAARALAEIQQRKAQSDA
jgi:chromosome segregation ATPase